MVHFLAQTRFNSNVLPPLYRKSSRDQAWANGRVRPGYLARTSPAPVNISVIWRNLLPSACQRFEALLSARILVLSPETRTRGAVFAPGLHPAHAVQEKVDTLPRYADLPFGMALRPEAKIAHYGNSWSWVSLNDQNRGWPNHAGQGAVCAILPSICYAWIQFRLAQLFSQWIEDISRLPNLLSL